MDLIRQSLILQDQFDQVRHKELHIIIFLMQNLNKRLKMDFLQNGNRIKQNKEFGIMALH